MPNPAAAGFIVGRLQIRTQFTLSMLAGGWLENESVAGVLIMRHVQVQMEPFVSRITPFSLCEKSGSIITPGKRLARKHLRKLHTQIFALAHNRLFLYGECWLISFLGENIKESEK